MAQQPPEGAILECLWDTEGKFIIKEDDWECPECTSYNDNKHEVNGKQEQLYKCATCDATRPGFAQIRRKKDKEINEQKGTGFGDFEISFGGKSKSASELAAAAATSASGKSSQTLDLFGGASSSSSSSDAKPATKKAGADGGKAELDLFGGSGTATATGVGLDLFGGSSSSSSSSSATTTASADEGGLDLFGGAAKGAANVDIKLDIAAPAAAPAAKRDTPDVAALLKFAKEGGASKASGRASKKRKAQDDGPTKRVRKEKEGPVDIFDHSAMLEVTYTRPAERVTSKQRELGKLFSFGSGEMDQLGHGRVEEDEDGYVDLEVKVPREIAHVKDVDFVHISCGGLHNAALDSKGRIFTWGCNDDKALGRDVDDTLASLINFYAKVDPKKDKESIEKIHAKYKAGRAIDTLFQKLANKYGFYPECDIVPGLVTAIEEKCVQVECGDSHTVALTETGRVYLWGCYKDAAGQLGFDAEGTDTQAVPKEVPGLYKRYGPVVQVASGANHTLVLSKKGAVFAWGDAEQGQLGRKVTRRHKTNGLAINTVGLPKNEKVHAVFCTGFSSFATMENGKAYCWGLNNYGQLGLGDKEPRLKVTPFTIPGHEIVQVAGGIHHTLALTKAGRVFAAGKCQSGQLGLPKHAIVKGGVQNLIQVASLGGRTIVDISSGSDHNHCRTSDGDVFVWGANVMSQLGLGEAATDDEVYTPAALSLKSFAKNAKVLQMDGGGTHSMALATISK